MNSLLPLDYEGLSYRVKFWKWLVLGLHVIRRDVGPISAQFHAESKQKTKNRNKEHILDSYRILGRRVFIFVCVGGV